MEKIAPLPKEERERRLAEMANSVQGGTPPRENLRENRTIDVVVGRGSTDLRAVRAGSAHAATNRQDFCRPSRRKS